MYLKSCSKDSMLSINKKVWLGVTRLTVNPDLPLRVHQGKQSPTDRNDVHGWWWWLKHLSVERCLSQRHNVGSATKWQVWGGEKRFAKSWRLQQAAMSILHAEPHRECFEDDKNGTIVGKLTKTHSQMPCCLQHTPLRQTKAPQTRQSAGSFGTFLQAEQAFLW